MIVILAITLIVGLAWVVWRGSVVVMRVAAAVGGLAGLALIAGIYWSNRDAADPVGMVMLALPALAMIGLAVSPKLTLLRGALVLVIAVLAALLIFTLYGMGG